MKQEYKHQKTGGISVNNKFFNFLCALGVLLFMTGCISPYSLDGKKFNTPEAAIDYMDKVVVPREVAKVEKSQNAYEGSLLFAIPSDAQLQGAPFVRSAGYLSKEQKRFFVMYYKNDFNAVGKALKKSGMFKTVTVRYCADPHTYAKSNGYKYILKNFGTNLSITDINTGKSIDIGLSQGLKFTVQNIETGMSKLNAKIPSGWPVKSENKPGNQKDKINKNTDKVNNNLPEFLQ
ncbi:MAG: hypothetical protein WCS27_04450 [Victivallaceae bacterium]